MEWFPLLTPHNTKPVHVQLNALKPQIGTKKPISDQLMSEEGNINEPEELSTQALE